MKRTALVTGANRGIGFEICRQLAKAGHSVILGARDADAGEKAAATLRDDEGLDVTAVALDVAQDGSVEACAAGLKKQGVTIDMLVNNAGIIAKGDLLSGPDSMNEAIAVNLMGPLRTARAFVPAMAERGWGRVVNLSSNWGSFDKGLEGPAAYAVTKAALNALTVRLAREAGPHVLVNSMNPGWVQTRMGGDDATRTTEQGAVSALWLATLPDDGPTGGFFCDRSPTAW